jgi:hypothetical protein
MKRAVPRFFFFVGFSRLLFNSVAAKRKKERATLQWHTILVLLQGVYRVISQMIAHHKINEMKDVLETCDYVDLHMVSF